MNGMLNVLSSVADTVKAGDDSESKVVKSQQQTAENVTAWTSVNVWYAFRYTSSRFNIE